MKKKPAKGVEARSDWAHQKAEAGNKNTQECMLMIPVVGG